MWFSVFMCYYIFLNVTQMWHFYMKCKIFGSRYNSKIEYNSSTCENALAIQQKCVYTHTQNNNNKDPIFFIGENIFGF